MLAAWLLRCPAGDQLRTLCERYVAPTMNYIHGQADRPAIVSRVRSAAPPPKPRRLLCQSDENVIGTLIALVEVLFIII